MSVSRAFVAMKTSPIRSSRPQAPPLSSKGHVRKSSQERREKQKVESTLRQLLGSSEDASQLELVLAAISYIRELQDQLTGEQDENHLPVGFERLFEKAF